MNGICAIISSVVILIILAVGFIKDNKTKSMYDSINITASTISDVQTPPVIIETEAQTYEYMTTETITQTESQTETQPAEILPSQPETLPNSVYKGRIIIPEYNINTRLFKAEPESDTTRAAIVDALDSACFMIFDNTYVVGDHRSHGFSALWNAYVGLSAIWEDESGYQHGLQAVRVDHNGLNKYNLYWSEIERAYPGPGHFVLYTCNPTGEPESVTIVDFAILN